MSNKLIIAILLILGSLYIFAFTYTDLTLKSLYKTIIDRPESSKTSSISVDTTETPVTYQGRPKNVFKIEKNNIYKISPDGNELVATIGSELKSPDGTKTAFLGEGSINSLLLFVKDNSTNKVNEVGTAEEIVWSNNSRYIAYNSRVADAGSTYFLGVYDTKIGSATDLSSKIKKDEISENPLSYHNLRWISDNELEVDYVAYDEIPYGNVVKEGHIVIDITEP